MLTAIKDIKVTENETMFTIKFKVKSTIDVSSTSITLQNITVSGGRVIDGGTADISVYNATLTLNKIIQVESNSTNNFETVSSVARVDMSTPIVSPVEDEVVSTDMDISSDMTISTQVNSTDVVEKIKVADTSIHIDQDQNKNSDNIQSTIIGSASSISLLSIGYMLFRKFKFGI